MVPTLRAGDLLVLRYRARVRSGDVVVARHPLQHDLLIVKRAVEHRAGGWWLLGDNPYAEGDSRTFGVVPDELVLGRALCRYWPRPSWLSASSRLGRLLSRGRGSSSAARSGSAARLRAR